MTKLIDEFSANRGDAGFIPSILVGVTLGSGILSNRFFFFLNRSSFNAAFCVLL